MKYVINGKLENELKLELFFENKEINNEILKVLKERQNLKGKEVLIYRDIENTNRFAFLGLGKEEKISLETIRKSFFNLAKEMQKLNETNITISLPKLNNLCTRRIYAAALEAFLHAEYRFDKYKSNKEEIKEFNVNFEILKEKEEVVSKFLEKTYNTMESVFFARDLVNTPAMDLYPETLANITKENLEKYGVKVTVYNEEEVKNIGMEAFLSVGKGSANKPRLIVMEYLNNENCDKKIALVGKGVTYDTGGYSIKPNDGMKTMFCDMGGAATVIATMQALAKNNVKTNVYGVVAACENAISSNAYKPGDIIGSLSGKTIEVDNTDAEGRLTLADAIYYSATTLKADKIIDLATLTGACLVALASFVTGAVTNDEAFLGEILDASKLCGEPIWQLPTSDDFRSLNKSKVADIKNSGGRMGGTITAGLFLEEFTNKTPWIHLDIAGTAFLDYAYSYLPYGATGVHVKTLVEYLSKEKCCMKK